MDADEVIAYAIALAKDLGVSIPKRKRLYRMLKRKIPIPQIYQGADYRLWVDRYYIAAQHLADESVRYVYLTRIHIRSETLADQRMKRLYGVPLLDSEARGQFIAARCAMERFQTDYALAAFPPHRGAAGRGWIWTRHGAARERTARHRANIAATERNCKRKPPCGGDFKASGQLEPDGQPALPGVG